MEDEVVQALGLEVGEVDHALVATLAKHLASSGVVGVDDYAI